MRISEAAVTGGFSRRYAQTIVPRDVSRHALMRSTQNKKGLITPQNAPIHIECTLLKHVVSSAAEAETGALFHNWQVALGLKNILEALGHIQQPIQIKTDNATTSAYCNSTLK